MSLFGTDGVRGPAGRGPLGPVAAMRLAAAFGRVLPDGAVAVARDTRLSGGMLSGAISAGLAAAGREVLDLGVLPTPALSWYCAREDGVSGAVMITASHNPWPDNGLKLFGGDGLKAPDALQEACEAEFAALEAAGSSLEAEPTAVGPVQRRDAEARHGYLASLRADLRGTRPLAGRTVVVDTAAGAAAGIAEQALSEAGAVVLPLAPGPDGRTINDGIGAVHPEALAARVLAAGAWGGLALDGDGDRIMLADERGAVHDGDAILGFLAEGLLARGALAARTVVGTLTTNSGLEAFLGERGVELVRTKVGDRHVAAAMTRLGAVLGGETSGHVLTPKECPTGDGLRVGLRVLREVAEAGTSLSRALGAVPRFPVETRSVRVAKKPPLAELPGLSAVCAEADRELAASGGRTLVRYSGTEPVLRVQVEDVDPARAGRLADAIARAAAQALT